MIKSSAAVIKVADGTDVVVRDRLGRRLVLLGAGVPSARPGGGVPSGRPGGGVPSVGPGGRSTDLFAGLG
jgi:hypothetical protein